MKTIYIVKYRRRTGERRILRTGHHHNVVGVPDKAFRLALVSDYNRTNKRVESIRLVKVSNRRFEELVW
jgi:hypothetical protein